MATANFQNQVVKFPGLGVPGDKASLNPFVYTDRNYVAGNETVTVGNFVFVDPDLEDSYAVGSSQARLAAAGKLIGGAVTTEAATLKLITDGSMKLSIDGEAVTLSSVSFANITAVGDCAAILQTALRTAASDANLTVTYSGTTGAFTITSGTTGATSSVGYASAGASGTNIATLLALTLVAGATSVSGTAAYTPTVLGIVQRNLSYVNYDILDGGTLIVPKLAPLQVVLKGDLYAVAATDAVKGQKVFAVLADGSLKTGAASASISGALETKWVVTDGGTAGELITISSWRS